MKTHTACRACGASDLLSVLDLGDQPLANRFLTDAQLEEPEPRYPLHLLRCPACGLCQLSVVVDPSLLYGPGYAYRSGVSETWKQHCRELAEEIGEGKTVLDIGCLDGVLLDACCDHGSLPLGCDPSSPISAFKELFGRDTRIGLLDVIVAQNVFGHVDDAKGFLEGVKANLAPGGYAVIECPWAVDLIRGGRWDTVYHEHVSCWSIGSLGCVAQAAGLQVARQRYFPDIHGGTMRYYLDAGDAALGDILDEHYFDTNLDYDAFTTKAEADIDNWSTYFLNRNGKAIAAYGASAKLNTFLNALNPRPPIIGVFDDSPEKQGLYTPGWHYPVLRPTPDTMAAVEVLLIGSPNIAEELTAKAKALGFSGEVKSLWR